MSAVKLEAVVCHEPDESELNRFSDNNGSQSVVYQLLDQIHNHDKTSRGLISER